MAEIAEGQKAPAFEVPLGDGSSWRSADHAGRPLVVYFYPKDDTSGCTAEALDFSRLKPEFEAAGAVVIGISPDSAKSHAKFSEKHGLSHHLGADEERKAIEAFGVWAEKSMYGKKYWGVDRSTFLIDREGRIARAWRKVKVPGHAEEVLAAVKAL
jgi:thioredoxin-dependent peroxiredoxin